MLNNNILCLFHSSDSIKKKTGDTIRKKKNAQTNT